MCIGSKPSAPALPALPEPPPPVQTPVAPEVVKARQDARTKAALSGGRDATIATNPQGLPLDVTATAGKKKLTGV